MVEKDNDDNDDEEEEAGMNEHGFGNLIAWYNDNDDDGNGNGIGFASTRENDDNKL